MVSMVGSSKTRVNILTDVKMALGVTLKNQFRMALRCFLVAVLSRWQ